MLNHIHYERRIVTTALSAVVPIAIVALVLVWSGDYAPHVRWTVVAVTVASIFTATYVLHEVLTYPLRSVSNLITALREEDYSLRAHEPSRDDAVGEILAEVNALSELMESRKLEAVEATALLRAVLAEIDAAIFAFDGDDRLRLINRAGERMLNAPAARVDGLTATELGLAELLSDDAPHTLDRKFAVRRSTFREHGIAHRLLVVADISRALREEETEAWRRIVRVIGHELNNSLAPIKSISGSLEQLLARDPLPDDWRDDVASGMRVIGSRSEALTRFTRAYAQLARLPEPRKQRVQLAEVIRRVVALETRVRVTLAGESVTVDADEDQLEQLLINIVRNAAEASMANGGAVTVHWRARRGFVEVLVEDEGPGIAATANLFVPFFTTKPGGTGVGLVLSRQIAEAHGGTLTLENRADARGCVARLTLPG
ncbi:MAG TPA: ATP-binding protein [Thermoanaerobaculia bacterium]